MLASTVGLEKLLPTTLLLIRCVTRVKRRECVKWPFEIWELEKLLHSIGHFEVAWETGLRVLLNWPFPRSCLPPLQGESKCEVFVMVSSSTVHMNENLFS